MKRTSFTLAVALVAVFGLLSVSHLFTTAHAQSDRAQSEGTGAPEIIRHSLNQNGNGPNAFALTAGRRPPSTITAAR